MGDVGITEELVAVSIVDLDVGQLQLGGSGINALHKAVAIALDSGDSHAAQEAQVLVAQLHSSVAGHVAAQLFLIHSAVQVGGNLKALAQVTGGHVQRDELDIGELGGGLRDGGAEGVAGHHDDVVALIDSTLDHGHTVGGVIAGGLEVLEVHTVGLRESLAGLVGGLVEGLVGDIAVVGDHSDLVRDIGNIGIFVSVVGSIGILVLLAAGYQRQCHDQSQHQRKKLLHHSESTFLKFLFSRQRRENRSAPAGGQAPLWAVCIIADSFAFGKQIPRFVKTM